ncbi:hypothetical protein EMCRGX_G011098 [Ephydatia muelleri]
MSGNTCIVCQSTRCNEPLLKFYRIPPDLNKRALWLHVLHLSDHILKPHYRVCSKHFRDGDPKNGPELLLGKKFATPVKRNDATTRSILRQKKELQTLSASTSRMDPDSPHLSTLPQPSIIQPTVDAQPLQPSNTLDVNIDEPNLSMSSLSCATSEEPNLDALSPTPVVDELPSCSYTSMQLPLSSATTVFVDSALQEIPAIIHRSSTADNEQYKLNSALIARVEILEAEKLKNTISKAKLTLTVEDLKDDENLFSFYTGFKSYNIFLAFFEFLGPAVYKLHYWGSKTTQVRKKPTKTSANGPVTYDPYEAKT